jgi:hypothetical protein
MERSARVSTDEGEIELLARPENKADLMPRIERYWAELGNEIGALSEAEMTAPGPDGGWAVKDHLAHVTVWERILMARTAHEPEHGIFGLDEAAYAHASLDEVNARVYERWRNAPLVEVLAAFAKTHRQVVAALEKLSDDELARPVFPDDPERVTLLGNAAGDTYEHYIEHLTWIRAARTRTAGER